MDNESALPNSENVTSGLLDRSPEDFIGALVNEIGTDVEFIRGMVNMLNATPDIMDAAVSGGTTVHAVTHTISNRANHIWELLNIAVKYASELRQQTATKPKE